MRPWFEKWFIQENDVDEMETPASNAATDGGYGVSDTQHQAETVLGKGKVDGSIPFGSTIFPLEYQGIKARPEGGLFAV
jgi:hypothetical protein